MNVFFPNYSVPVIPKVDFQKLQPAKAEEEKKLIAQETAVQSVREETETPSAERADARLEDISITFNKNENFDYLGQDSDVRKLDVEKAVSDMQKDQMLQQYQYFVGSSSNIISQNQDGLVIAKL